MCSCEGQMCLFKEAWKSRFYKSLSLWERDPARPPAKNVWNILQGWWSRTVCFVWWLQLKRTKERKCWKFVVFVGKETTQKIWRNLKMSVGKCWNEELQELPYARQWQYWLIFFFVPFSVLATASWTIVPPIEQLLELQDSSRLFGPLQSLTLCLEMKTGAFVRSPLERPMVTHQTCDAHS